MLINADVTSWFVVGNILNPGCLERITTVVA